MKFEFTESNLFIVIAAVVILFTLTTFSGWVSHIYEGDVATISRIEN